MNPAARKDLTIVAPATGNQMAAIGVVRLSGSQAFEITEQVFSKKIAHQPGYTIHFGKIKDQNRVVDEVLVSIFKSPNSYTGDDIVEISCHGSPYIVQEIVNLLVKQGAALAEPGEFTMRAFLNGKMDLSQAEAVADLIASESYAGHALAMQQMRGGISKLIEQLRNQLLHFSAMLELELDFSTEDVEFANRGDLLILLNKISKVIKQLIGSFALGNAIKKGIPVCIVGRPNAGKSTLLNALLNDDRAIVSEIAGTTRDSIEDHFVFNGISFRLIDTAGLRETNDTIESIGIERSYVKMHEADYIIYLFDVNELSNEVVDADVQAIKNRVGGNKNIILVANKIDQITESEKSKEINSSFIQISAKELQGIEQVFETIAFEVNEQMTQKNEIISNVRHLEALNQCDLALNQTIVQLNNQISSDLLAFHIREALKYMALITGEVTNDEVLGHIFGKFCIGK